MLPNPISWTVGITAVVLLSLIHTLSELRAQRVNTSQTPQRTPRSKKLRTSYVIKKVYRNLKAAIVW
mgnify:FL=1